MRCEEVLYLVEGDNRGSHIRPPHSGLSPSVLARLCSARVPRERAKAGLWVTRSARLGRVGDVSHEEDGVRAAVADEVEEGPIDHDSGAVGSGNDDVGRRAGRRARLVDVDSSDVGYGLDVVVRLTAFDHGAE